MFSFCSPEVALCVNFIPSRCQICRDLRAFLGVNFALKDLLRVKDLTFRNSQWAQILTLLKELVDIFQRACLFFLKKIQMKSVAFDIECSDNITRISKLPHRHPSYILLSELDQQHERKS